MGDFRVALIHGDVMPTETVYAKVERSQYGGR